MLGQPMMMGGSPYGYGLGAGGFGMPGLAPLQAPLMPGQQMGGLAPQFPQMQPRMGMGGGAPPIPGGAPPQPQGQQVNPGLALMGFANQLNRMPGAQQAPGQQGAPTLSPLQQMMQGLRSPGQQVPQSPYPGVPMGGSPPGLSPQSLMGMPNGPQPGAPPGMSIGQAPQQNPWYQQLLSRLGVGGMTPGAAPSGPTNY